MTLELLNTNVGNKYSTFKEESSYELKNFSIHVFKPENSLSLPKEGSQMCEMDDVAQDYFT